jgi:DNA-binding MarR family transcriptional regulator
MNVAERSLAKDRLRLWLRLLKATRLVEGALRERMRAERGTTLPRFDVMAALYRAGEGLRMSDLSGVLMVSNGNVTGIVDRLEAEGLVERVAVAGDRRAVRVRLTARGREAFEDMAEEHEVWVDGLLSGLTPSETETAARLLEKLAGGVIAGRGA